MIDHMGVQAADVEASLAFYVRAFGPIELREAMRFPAGPSFVVGLAGPEGAPDFWLSPAQGTETRELHVAFRASGRDAVDAVHAPRSRRGPRCCTPPASGPSTTRVTTRGLPARSRRPRRGGRVPRRLGRGLFRGHALRGARPSPQARARPARAGDYPGAP